ncbi:MAG: DUF5916 domain-containing protein [Bacteroidetes bacterium]|nr:DUF5916 domain-containing protein [Bacteroidota bacterium]MDA1335661.1 DUF5916 domain-containing protein [Bacteroidota bacterium]
MLSQVKREATGVRLSSALEIDGKLNDPAWNHVPENAQFIQYAPQPGQSPSQSTSVKIAYDDNALYIGARMWDTAPDSILHQLSERDETQNTDEFGIWFSPFNDGLNAVRFITTPDGVQIDEQISPNGNDPSWDAVWDVVCSIDSLGWVAEFRIPWMAFRFPENSNQRWGMNMFRSIRRHREESVWNPMDPTQRLLNQGGVLTGIAGVDPPPRLSIFPYLSAYQDWQGAQSGHSYNGGMDMKVGLGNAFTLDMTLVPDFGQVVTDNLVLNLSPFEIQFNENRQFFQEGTELFNKSGVFYSRRIGGEGRLVNASKVSGRLDNGLGLGILQALATNDSDTSLVSYTIAVADQNLPNNGFVTSTTSLVTREGSNYDAWVQAGNFEIRNEANTWALSGNGAFNQKFNADSTRDDEGHKWGLAVQKMSGNFTFNLGHYIESAEYDPNDLGYLQAPNEVVNYLNLDYGIFEPRGKFNRINYSLNFFYNRIETPRMFNNWFLSASCRATTRKFNTWNLEVNSQPVDGNNFFASRIDGRIWQEPSWYSLNGWYSSDYRKQFAIDLGYWYGGGSTYRDWKEMTYRVAPRIRINDQLMVRYVWKIIDRQNERGWAMLDTLDNGDMTSIFGQRENRELTQVLNCSYIFTNRMSISARIRHSWSKVIYDSFYELPESGSLSTDPYITSLPTSDYNLNYNAWSVDLVYQWNFAPGSEINIVWKNQLFQEQLQGDLETNNIPESYSENVKLMLDSEFFNSLSIRLVSFIDYSRIKQGLRGFEKG